MLLEVQTIQLGFLWIVNVEAEVHSLIFQNKDHQKIVELNNFQ